MTSYSSSARSIYRVFLRGLRSSAQDQASFINLRRLYRPQLRDALTEEQISPEELLGQFNRTLSLLSSSPKLARNLSSLSYHHTPYHLPHTSNGSRLSHLPRPITWNPQDPAAAGKAWEKRRKDAVKDPVQKIAQGVEAGLGRLWREAEKARGGVLLGRITARRYGDD
ncbi:hypothetical protein JCM8547_000872 [Rhodosporidiobolus lusitaniae]